MENKNIKEHKHSKLFIALTERNNQKGNISENSKHSFSVNIQILNTKDEDLSPEDLEKKKELKQKLHNLKERMQHGR